MEQLIHNNWLNWQRMPNDNTWFKWQYLTQTPLPLDSLAQLTQLTACLPFWCQATSSCTCAWSPLIFCLVRSCSSKLLSIQSQTTIMISSPRNAFKSCDCDLNYQRHCRGSLSGSLCSHTSFIGFCRWPHTFSMILITSFGGSCNQWCAQSNLIKSNAATRELCKSTSIVKLVNFQSRSWHKTLSFHPTFALPEPYPKMATRRGHCTTCPFQSTMDTWVIPKQTHTIDTITALHPKQTIGTSRHNWHN